VIFAKRIVKTVNTKIERWIREASYNGAGMKKNHKHLFKKVTRLMWA